MNPDQELMVVTDLRTEIRKVQDISLTVESEILASKHDLGNIQVKFLIQYIGKKIFQYFFRKTSRQCKM